MKSLKLALAALALFAAVASPSLRAADAARGAEARVNRIDQTVGLTAEQKSKIKDIISANAEKIRSAAPADRKALAKEEMAAINAVLTPDQQAKFKAVQAENAGKAKKSKKKKNQE